MDAVKLRRNEPAQSERCRHSHSEAESEEQQDFPHHHPDYGSAHRTKGHAHSDLFRPPGDDARHDAVHAWRDYILFHFVDCMRTGEEFESSGEDYLKTLRVVFAAYSSSLGERPNPMGGEARRQHPQSIQKTGGFEMRIALPSCQLKAKLQVGTQVKLMSLRRFPLWAA